MEPALVLDIHTHTIASGHAYGTIREMAAAARDRGLRLLGLSEHAPGIPGTISPTYFLNLKVVPRRLSGVEILHGVELNCRPDGGFDMADRYLEGLDYALVGIHSPCHKDQGREANTDNLIACMRHKKVFFVSHPDDSHTPLDYPRLVEAAKACHVALEVNNNSLRSPQRRLGVVENYKTMLALCMEMRVPIVVSSDAHDPCDVGNFTLARELLASVGFDWGLVLNTSTEKLREFLGCPREG